MDSQSKGQDRTWHEQVPKVELHLHLEGAIPAPALWELVQKYGGDPEVRSLEALQRRFVFRDFAHFIDTWVWKNSYLREYDDFAWIAEAFARDLERQNIVYAEAFFSPSDFARHGLAVQPLACAVRKGLSRVPGVKVNLVADFVRDFGPENGERVLGELQEVRDQGIIGIGIGGSEHQYPPEPFAKVYEKARSQGFRTSAHAGEAAGPESIWGAVRALHVDRIGHGTRAVQDPNLVAFLAKTQIAIEMCPLSNVRTGVVRSVEEHPIRAFFKQGLRVTVNTDDPAMFNNSLAEELWLLETKAGFERQELRQVILQAVQASWLQDSEKDALTQRLCTDPHWL